MKVCVCVCAYDDVREREKQRERERKKQIRWKKTRVFMMRVCRHFIRFHDLQIQRIKNWGEFFFAAKRRKNTEAVAIIKKSQLCCFDEKTTAPQKFLKNARSVGLRLRENNSSDSLAIVIMVRLCLNDLKGQMIRKTGSHT